MLNDNNTTSDPFKKFLIWYSEAQTGKDIKGPKSYLISSGFRLLRRIASVLCSIVHGPGGETRICPSDGHSGQDGSRPS